MNDAEIEAIALANGFRLKAQNGGKKQLNPYVFEFARALLAAACPPQEPVAVVRVLEPQEGSYQSTLYWIADPMPDGTPLYAHQQQPIKTGES